MSKQHSKSTTLGGDAVRLTLSKVLTLCITMATTMLLARFRSFQEYGTYSQLLLVINLVSSLLMLGLPNSINYFLARADKQEDRRKFLSLYYVLSTSISFVIGLVLVLAIPLIELYFKNYTIRYFYYFLALYPWASIVSSSIENVLVVYKKTKRLIVYRIAHSLAILSCVVIVQVLGLDFTAYMISFIIVNVLFTLLVYFISFRMCEGFSISFDKKLIKAIFAFSIPFGLASVIGTLNTEIDKLLIGYLMNTEQLAIYTNAAKELPLAIVASSITAVLLPQLTRMIKNNKSLDAVNLWGYATELSMILMSVVIFGVFTFAEDAMSILYSEKYLPGVSVFRIYTLNLLLRITYFGIVLNACGKSKKIFYCSLISLGLNVVLNPVFYYIFGMIGPAIATFLAILIIQLLQLFMTSKLVNVSFSKVFPWKRLLITVLINFLFSTIFYFIKRFMPLEKITGSIIESLCLGAIWTAIYLFIMKKRIKLVWNTLNKKEYNAE